MNENFGIMDQGYFVSKNEILAWINDLLQVNVTKIESLGAGHIYCQILDSMDAENRVPMHKVNFKAKLEYEFLQNLKILQNSFTKFKLKKHIEVEKLSKCKYQDNLEMIQWLKRLFDLNGGAKVDYDPVARRKGGGIDVGFANKTVKPKLFTGQGQQQPQSTAQKTTKQATGKVVPPSKRASQPKQDQNQLLEAVQIQLLEKTHKLERIKAVLLENIDDSDKVSQISGLLGMQNIIQASKMQDQLLQKQQQQLLDQQREHELLMQQQQEQKERELQQQELLRQQKEQQQREQMERLQLLQQEQQQQQEQQRQFELEHQQKMLQQQKQNELIMQQMEQMKLQEQEQQQQQDDDEQFYQEEEDVQQQEDGVYQDDNQHYEENQQQQQEEEDDDDIM